MAFIHKAMGIKKDSITHIVGSFLYSVINIPISLLKCSTIMELSFSNCNRSRTRISTPNQR